jgi:hypothetical protein
MLFAQAPDLTAEILRFSMQEGSTWSEWELQGTSAEGRRTLLRGVVICTFQDDLINWTRFYLDPVTHDRPEA